MKKLLLAAVAVFTIASASSSFAGGCDYSYVTVQQKHYEPTYIVKEQCHKQLITVPVYQPVHVEKKIIVKQPCHTTYVKPCFETYKVHTPVIYNYNHGYNYAPLYNYHYAPSSCGY